MGKAFGTNIKIYWGFIFGNSPGTNFCGIAHGAKRTLQPTLLGTTAYSFSSLLQFPVNISGPTHPHLILDYCFRYGALLDTAFFTFIVAIDTYRRPLRHLGALHACCFYEFGSSSHCIRQSFRQVLFYFGRIFASEARCDVVHRLSLLLVAGPTKRT